MNASAAPPPAPGSRPGLAIVLHAGGYDRVHYALVMASGAAAIGRRVILFVTGRALHALTIDRGWARLDFSEDGTSPCSRDATLAHRGVATLEELLEAVAELGVRTIACEMGWRAIGLDTPRLRPELKVETAGIVTLLNAVAPGDQMVFV